MATVSENSLQTFSQQLARAVEATGSSVLGVQGRQRHPASGVVWRDQVVVTADHTIEREEGITVISPQGEELPATLAGRDPSTDIAVLQVAGLSTPAASTGRAAGLEIGHLVLAVARPGASLAASMGTVSALGGPWRSWAGGQIDRLIRPDLTLYPGFSGGALADASGQTVGIATSGLARSLPLAIPAETVERVLEQILTTGRVARGYLGVGLQPVRLPEDRTGLIVVSLEPQGPADQAGILVGDILLALNGQPLADTGDVQTALLRSSIGSPVQAETIRGGVPHQATITVGERPRRGA